ncbi:HIT family protein [Paenibacillus mucilaginosus]|uniref:Cell-cycle regulation histidine triad protein n=3 Tax=Paenibacillus mucilaginosus TaxID=61624 RepID=H6NH38_9BACL|nr:HIT domain-containing protein [Paenibacillus mucilaginosus]AFC28716.1 cell-cycle regulation histidine triad protein [Paenibacillus mucilaginosus 3016]MCG7215670.1 HIT domain-containing protein [Paenibacillus mucilaginosus]
MQDCVFCHVELEPKQRIVLENEHCMFLQLDTQEIPGAGVLVTKAHRESVFDLTPEEWNAVQPLLLQVKAYMEEAYRPDGYNIGWNCGAVGGQTLSHAHLHVLPRYADEFYAGKGIRHLYRSPENRRASASSGEQPE